jgi:hypothetical protein
MRHFAAAAHAVLEFEGFPIHVLRNKTALSETKLR